MKRRLPILAGVVLALCIAVMSGCSPAANDEPTTQRVSVYGDSFSSDWQWIAEAREITDAYDFDNNAVWGAAYHLSGATDFTAIEDQIDESAIDSDIVVFYAGVNDWRNEKSTPDEVVASIERCVAKARHYAPLADIYVCFSNAGDIYQPEYAGFLEWHDEVIAKLERDNNSDYPFKPFVVVSDAPYWHMGTDYSFSDDALHPNEHGYEIIAERILSLLAA